MGSTVLLYTLKRYAKNMNFSSINFLRKSSFKISCFNCSSERKIKIFNNQQIRIPNDHIQTTNTKTEDLSSILFILVIQGSVCHIWLEYSLICIFISLFPVFSM